MRRHFPAMVLAGLFVLPAATLAKPNHQPGSCPGDVDAALAAACPCPGTMLPDASVTPWRNHGQYVRCVAHARNAFRKGGCLTPDARRGVVPCAAHSTCGKAAEPVTCCVPVTGACSDTTSGDGIKQGTCSNDPTLTCDVATDCTEVHAQQTADAAACTALGGAPGAGTKCNPCVTPAP